MPTEVERILRLLLAAALGGIIGYQRAKAEKPVGMRDLMLICIGAALFTIVSNYGFGGTSADPSRVAAGVVTGIGFLGAGAIIRRHGGLLGGMTTAATVWVVAGIGLAAGSGMYLIAGLTAVVTFGILLIPHNR